MSLPPGIGRPANGMANPGQRILEIGNEPAGEAINFISGMARELHPADEDTGTERSGFLGFHPP